MSESAPPPSHVVAAFGADGVSPVRLPGGSGAVWRCDDAVLRPAGDPVAAAWTATVFESLRVGQIRVPRPIRSLDGRWVVGGWCAQRFLSGRPAPRYEESMTASRYLSAALKDVPPARFLADREDPIGWADRLAWDADAEGVDRLSRLDHVDGAGLWLEIAAGREPVGAPDQVVHADLFGNVLFAGPAPPAIIDFTPLVRPAAYPAAVLVVDALAWGGAALDLAADAASEPEWQQLLRRACLFRLAQVLTHPRTTPAAQQQLVAATRALRPLFR